MSHLGLGFGLRILNGERCIWLTFRLLLLHVGGLRLNFELDFGLRLRLWFCWRYHCLRLHLRLGLFGRLLLFFLALRLLLLSSAHDDLLSVLLAEAVVIGVQAIDEGRLQSCEASKLNC